MSNNNQYVVDELASIIKLLANVWPNDRENVAAAGAKFEGIIASIDQNYGQMQKLSNLAWEGIKHLYEKEDYFITVKSCTMQAINLFREYIISDGDIKVEDFEKAYEELEKALSGDIESADSVIELSEQEIEAYHNDEQQTPEEISVPTLSGDEISGELAAIIKLLADVWPKDRENVALAGAKFESVMVSLDENSGQNQKLANLAWEGIKHLYQKDDFFMTVKSCTMQAVNMFREYLISDGDVNVTDFEKAYEELEKALIGNSESADSVIELDEEQISEYSEMETVEPTSSEDDSIGDGLLPKETTLDDLAAYIMMLDEDSATPDQIERLVAFIRNSMRNESPKVAEPLKNALELSINAFKGQKENAWLSIVSVHIEEATERVAKEEWEESTESLATESVVEEITQTELEAPIAEAQKPAEEPAEKEVFHIPVDIEITMVGEFITECSELIESAESALLELESSPDDNELVNTVFRAFHTIKGTSAFMGLDPITEFTHHVETVLSIVRDGDLPFDRACADINFESIDIIKQLLSVVEVSNGGDPLQTPPTYDSMLRILIDVSENKVEPATAFAKERGNQAPISSGAVEVKPEDLLDAPVQESIQQSSAKPVDEQNPNAPKADSESSVRVSVNRLDRLIDMVGELVIAHSVVAQDQNIPKDSELQKKVNHATKILRELQDTSLTLRMVPLKATFHKMNRLVRDLSRKAGKPVKFTTSGEDTEIDRNMVDIINEPLIHMLRNSLDHGIETPEQRKGTDKSPVANIHLRASQEGGKVVIQIQDDGRGINKEVILNKAIEKGLVEPDKKLTDAEIYGLIFLPGFSSAEKVTDLSGRGVGMDVVRRSIEQLQGKVEVTSELGVGTTITIELPFTLAITDGMLIRVGSERFIVPTINIDMTFRAEVDDLFTVLGNSEQVSFRGHSVPVIRLHRLFEINGATEDILEGTLLVIKNNKDRYALLVDEVIGQQQLVGKSINMIATNQHISGGAILGDGRVGLILDTAALMV